jgi:hypothetical protein
MKRAKERKRSAERQLSMRDRKAETRRLKDSKVKSSPLSASSNLLLTPMQIVSEKRDVEGAKGEV